MAMRKGDKVFYLYGDHLGSTTLATNESREVVYKAGYLPYGGERLSDGVSPTDFGFTDQRQELGIGLYDYNARYYEPYLGRFISPDTIVPEPTSSSGLNRYRYARNNPVKYNDPSGHCVGLALGMDTAFCVAVGKIVVDVAVVAIATYLIVDSTQEIGQTINDLLLNQVNPPVTSGGYGTGELAFNDPLYHPGPTLGGEYTVPLHLPGPSLEIPAPNTSLGFPNVLSIEEEGDWKAGKRLTTSKGRIMKEFGLSKRDFNKIIHAVKDQIPDNPDVVTDLDTGNIYDPRSGEWIGNWLDYLD